MKRYISKPLIFIFLVSLLLRILALGVFPSGFHADEARVGWNARSIVETLRDDRGNLFALYYNTFGDYRPTGIFYLTTPSVALLGNTVFATRFPSAFVGAITVLPLYFFAFYITKNKRIALLSSLFLSIIPWHITTSRATSEVVVSLFLVLSGFALFQSSLKSKSKKALVIGSLLLFASFIFYHSVRILVPLFILSFILVERKSLIKVHLIKPYIYICLLFFTLTGILSLTGESLARLSQVAIANDPTVVQKVLGTKTSSNKFEQIFSNKLTIYVRSFVDQYTIYLSPNFFIGDAAKPARYRVQGVSIVGLPIFAFFIVGLIEIARKKASLLLPVFLLIAPLPAALTIEDSPNLHRAFFVLPFLVIIAAIGANSLIKKRALIAIGTFGLLFLSTINFLVNYTDNSQQTVGQYRNEKYTELAFYLNEVKGDYDKVYITNDPDSPYPWYSYFNNEPASLFNSAAVKRSDGDWEYENIIWSQNKCPAGEAFNKNDQNILVIEATECEAESIIHEHPTVSIFDQWKSANGKVLFTFLKN